MLEYCKKIFYPNTKTLHILLNYYTHTVGMHFYFKSQLEATYLCDELLGVF